MKRILFLALGLLLAVGSASAQTDAKAKALIDRYNLLSGMDKSQSDGSALMEVNITMAMQSMPMKVIKGAQTGCFRIEMTIPGQGEVLMITDGKQGWVAAKGVPVQALPKNVIEQLAAQGDVSGTLSVDEQNIVYTYVGTTNNNEVIEGKPKPGAEGLAQNLKRITMAFSVETGLLTSVSTVTDKGQQVDISVSAYKKFGNVMMPTRMETTMAGAQNAVVTIKNVEFGIPTEAWMFAKPAAIQ